MVNYEKLRDDINANEEDYAAAWQEMLRKRSDIKTVIEALLKAGDKAAFLRSLEDAEQRLAHVLVNSVVDKSSKHGTSPQNKTATRRQAKGT